MSAKRNRDKSDRATTKDAAVAKALDQLEERVRSLQSALHPEPDTQAARQADGAAVPAQAASATERADALSAELDAIEHDLALRGRKSFGRASRLLMIVGLLLLLVAPFYFGLWLAVRDLTAEDTRARLFWSLCQKETTAEKRAQAFLELAAFGHTEWRSARLQDAVLTRARLNDAQLVDVDFGAVRLDEANLERADLTRANLKAADLSAASLSGAVLTDANWWRAVGLTPETIERLVNEFPPSPNAASERVEDYKRWQSERAGGNGR